MMNVIWNNWRRLKSVENIFQLHVELLDICMTSVSATKHFKPLQRNETLALSMTDVVPVALNDIKCLLEVSLATKLVDGLSRGV